MKRIIIVKSWLFLATFLSAQEADIDSLFRISGHVLFSRDSTGIQNVHVLNITKGTGTITSTDGNFRLTTRDRDTLEFSCIGYKDRYLLISRIMLRENLLVFLERDTVLMNEVLIHPLGPRRFFKYTFLSLKLPEPKIENRINENFARVKNYERPIPEPGIRITGPIQALYNTFNKKDRLRRKLRKNRERYNYDHIAEDSLGYN